MGSLDSNPGLRDSKVSTSHTWYIFLLKETNKSYAEGKVESLKSSIK